MNDKDETCWQANENNDTPCQNKECRLWLECKAKQNCTIIAAKGGPLTLQEIGNLHELKMEIMISYEVLSFIILLNTLKEPLNQNF